MARQGQDVDLEPRAVTVYRLDVVGYDYPELKLEIECGSGTYVRSLGRDLAQSLGTAAVMSALVRTAIGGLPRRRGDRSGGPLAEANWIGHLQPPLDAVGSLPRVELTADGLARIRSGQTIPRPPEAPDQATELAAVDAAGRLVAILIARGPGFSAPCGTSRPAR